MRRLIASISFGALATTLASSAFAQPAPPAAAEKKLGIGGDLLFLLPVGDLADISGPQLGPVARVGYRVIPPLELTGRIGYLFGFSKSQSSVLSTSVSNLPIWLGARYFFLPAAGPYAGAEIGANILRFGATVDGNVPGAGNFSVAGSTTESRFGFNLAGGYVISPELPIDLRLQFSYLNLIGTDTNEKALLGLGLSVGYTFQL